MIRIAIVEDEAVYVQQLCTFIWKYEEENGQHFTLTVFSDGEDILESYSCQYDIILMDIQMKFMDGMTAAEKIREMDTEVVLMFITNMTQYAVRGYEVDAMDYVVKPVEYFAFSHKLEKAIRRIRRKKQKFITVPTEGGIMKLNLSELVYIESRGHNALFRSETGTVVSRISLKELEERLSGESFFRCSKGFLVNMKLVEGLSGGDCIAAGYRIPVSRNRRKEFGEQLIQYINEG